MLKKVFVGDEWIITLEKRDCNSPKRPDQLEEKRVDPILTLLKTRKETIISLWN